MEKRYHSEFYMIEDEQDRVKVIKRGRPRWLGHVFRMQELDPCRKLTVLKPWGNRRVGKSELRRLESVEEDLKKTDLRKWRRTVLSPTRKETSYNDIIFWCSYILFIIIIGGILVLFMYITRLASNEIFSPSNKIYREVGRDEELSAPR